MKAGVQAKVFSLQCRPFGTPNLYAAEVIGIGRLHNCEICAIRRELRLSVDVGDLTGFVIDPENSATFPKTDQDKECAGFGFMAHERVGSADAIVVVTCSLNATLKALFFLMVACEHIF
ncbi:MAG: hypothetical protein O9273_05200 [Acetobacteraceae bacterium]|nr:hypothetical protein [Acetobacteraceae bacterium]